MTYWVNVYYLQMDNGQLSRKYINSMKVILSKITCNLWNMREYMLVLTQWYTKYHLI